MPLSGDQIDITCGEANRFISLDNETLCDLMDVLTEAEKKGRKGRDDQNPI